MADKMSAPTKLEVIEHLETDTGFHNLVEAEDQLYWLISEEGEVSISPVRSALSVGRYIKHVKGERLARKWEKQEKRSKREADIRTQAVVAGMTRH
jgi:hypothetical protein